MGKSFAAVLLGATMLAAPFPAFSQSAAQSQAPARTVLSAADAASRFGAMEGVRSISLAPDGGHIVYVAPGSGAQTFAVVADTIGGAAKPVAHADGNPARLTNCGFSANDRIVCREFAVADGGAGPLSHLAVVRHISFDLDGRNAVRLGHRGNESKALRVSQFDGRVIDWLGGDGTILMTHDIVPEDSLGTNLAETRDGVALVRINTRTAQLVETLVQPNRDSYDFITDGHGMARIMALRAVKQTGYLAPVVTYHYRAPTGGNWHEFSKVPDNDTSQFRPIAVDGARNIAYAVRGKDGRDALYRVALDGSMHEELALARPDVDVDEVATIGRSGRVIGAEFVTDRRQISYFDPEYKSLAEKLGRALPGSPIIDFVGASADENKLLIFAGNDNDPGTYYLFDKASKHLSPLLPARAELDGVATASMQSIQYRAGDGTMISAYLTLPPLEIGKPVGAIVMPHGGPASRDEWGFDWLVQFFAHRGYAVLQPQFRGSTGYGEAWFADNGFQSWALAIGDVTAAGHYLIDQHIVTPDRLAIFGWSYGGYAALQSGATEPGLFKAIVAVAPVTDLGQLINDSRDFDDFALVQREVGSGPHVLAGSPARHAAAFHAPVLMFHGDSDLNVNINQSRVMDEALHRAGHTSKLVTFKGLDHQLEAGEARGAMLSASDAFLRASMGIN